MEKIYSKGYWLYFTLVINTEIENPIGSSEF